MLNTKIEKELNAQLNREIFSAYLYLSIAAYFESKNLKGFAHWLKVQVKEELSHALKFFNHIVDRNGNVVLEKIDAPKISWESPVEAFKDVYSHEQKITNHINDLVSLARTEKDYATENFLQWFVAEQVEEEAQSLEILQKLQQTGSSTGSLLVLDHHLGKREDK
jgi:ferritin